jgi:polyhydroxyalkanoate synthesis regulator phasin
MAKKAIEGLFEKGQELFGTVSAQLMEKPAFQQALATAMEQKGKVDAAVTTGLKRMNVATRADLRSLRSRVESLEAQVAELKEALAAARPKVRRKKA